MPIIETEIVSGFTSLKYKIFWSEEHSIDNIAYVDCQITFYLVCANEVLNKSGQRFAPGPCGDGDFWPVGYPFKIS